MAEIKFSGIVDGANVECTITGDDAEVAAEILARLCAKGFELGDPVDQGPFSEDDDLREYEKDVRRRAAFENAQPLSVSGGSLRSQDRALDMLHVGAEGAEAFGAGPVIAGEFGFETDPESASAAKLREKLLEWEQVNPPGTLGEVLTQAERELLEKIVMAGSRGVQSSIVLLGPGAPHDRLLRDFPALIQKGEDDRCRLTAAGKLVCWRQNVAAVQSVEWVCGPVEAHNNAPS